MVQDHMEGAGSFTGGYRGNGKGMKGSMDQPRPAVLTPVFHSFLTLPQVGCSETLSISQMVTARFGLVVGGS